ncbi:hypothetical protein D3C73_1573200 [compost metagenome]
MIYKVTGDFEKLSKIPVSKFLGVEMSHITSPKIYVCHCSMGNVYFNDKPSVQDIIDGINQKSRDIGAPDLGI